MREKDRALARWRRRRRKRLKQRLKQLLAQRRAEPEAGAAPAPGAEAEEG